MVVAPVWWTCAPSSVNRGEYRETLASAVASMAAAGGMTTIVTRPDTHPAIDETSHGGLHPAAPATRRLSMHPHGCAHQWPQRLEMTEFGLLMEPLALCAFTDGSSTSVTNAGDARRALTYARDFDALIVHHTGDPDLVGRRAS